MRLAAALAAAALAGATLAATAGPALAGAHDSLWWDARTTAAFWTYERHQSGCNFAIMAADATHADTYLRVDVGQWARDRARHAPARKLREDAYYVWADVTQPAD